MGFNSGFKGLTFLRILKINSYLAVPNELFCFLGRILEATNFSIPIISRCFSRAIHGLKPLS